MKIKLLITIGAALVLSACSTSNGVKSGAEQELENHVEASLMKSVERISKALDELEIANRGTKGVTNTSTAIGNTVAGRIVAKAGNPIDIKATSNTSETTKENQTKLNVDAKNVDAKSSKGKEIVLSVLDQRINMKWNGEAKDLLNSLSKKIGFKFQEQGVKTSLPVSILAKNKTIKEVFNLIDEQTKSKADISVSSIDKTVNLIYK